MLVRRRSLWLRWAVEGALGCLLAMAVLFTVTAVVLEISAASPTTRGVTALGVAMVATGLGAAFAAHRAWRRHDLSNGNRWRPQRDLLAPGLAGPLLLVAVGDVVALASSRLDMRSALALLGQQALLLLGALAGAAAVGRAAARREPPY